VKTVPLSQFLTETQSDQAVRLYKVHGMDAVTQIQAHVIEPNMIAINEKLGQENDARYLAYAVVYVFMQSTSKESQS